jgi:hypothetical protein
LFVLTWTERDALHFRTGQLLCQLLQEEHYEQFRVHVCHEGRLARAVDVKVVDVNKFGKHASMRADVDDARGRTGVLAQNQLVQKLVRQGKDAV